MGLVELVQYRFNSVFCFTDALNVSLTLNVNFHPVLHVTGIIFVVGINPFGSGFEVLY